MSHCPDCGRNLALVGRVHRCVPASVINNTEPLLTISAGEAELCAFGDGSIMTNIDRQAKWRKANADLNRQRAREGMRKRRAKQKD